MGKHGFQAPADQVLESTRLLLLCTRIGALAVKPSTDEESSAEHQRDVSPGLRNRAQYLDDAQHPDACEGPSQAVALGPAEGLAG